MTDQMFDALKKDALEITQAEREEATPTSIPTCLENVMGSLRGLASGGRTMASRVNTVISDLNVALETLGHEGINLPTVGEEAQGYTIGSIVVPIGNPNSHSYEHGRPILIIQSHIGLTSAGETGNILPNKSSNAMRLAEDNEIEEYFETLSVIRNRLSIFRMQ